jgi:penicillin-binding protein 1A
MTWRAIMSYAHQGIELKNIPGVAPNPAPGSVPQARVAAVPTATDTAPRPAVLTRRGAEVLLQVERLMDDAARGLAMAGTPAQDLPSGQQGHLPSGQQGHLPSGQQGHLPSGQQGALQRNDAFASALPGSTSGSTQGN